MGADAVEVDEVDAVVAGAGGRVDQRDVGGVEDAADAIQRGVEHVAEIADLDEVIAAGPGDGQDIGIEHDRGGRAHRPR